MNKQADDDEREAWERYQEEACTDLEEAFDALLEAAATYDDHEGA